MLTDGLRLIDNSSAVNFAVESGAEFPDNPDTAQLFYKTTSPVGLHVYSGSAWTLVGTGGGGGTYTAAGSTGQVQYNNNGALAASASLVFTPDSGNLAATSFSGSGASLTALNGSNISSGTIAPARLGSGTPTPSTYLRGDGVWSSSLQFVAATPTYAATQTIDLSTGNAFTITLTGNITSLSFTNVPSTGTLCEALLFLKQDAGGGRTVAWPASFKWSGGTAPVLTTAGTKTDIVFIVTVDGGTTWYASVVGLNF